MKQILFLLSTFCLCQGINAQEYVKPLSLYNNPSSYSGKTITTIVGWSQKDNECTELVNEIVNSRWSTKFVSYGFRPLKYVPQLGISHCEDDSYTTELGSSKNESYLRHFFVPIDETKKISMLIPVGISYPNIPPYMLLEVTGKLYSEDDFYLVQDINSMVNITIMSIMEQKYFLLISKIKKVD